jgi:hypothetical protein
VAFTVKKLKIMIFWLGVIAVAFLFYKWATSTYDYFELRGVKFMKPTFLMGSNSILFTRRSLPDTIKMWYNDSEMKNEK